MPNRKKARRTQPKKAAKTARKPRRSQSLQPPSRRTQPRRKGLRQHAQRREKSAGPRTASKKPRKRIPNEATRERGLARKAPKPREILDETSKPPEGLSGEADRARAQMAEKQLRETQERLRDALSRLDLQIREIAALQTSFLPTRFPPVGGLAFGALCRPCAEVAGDYYDVFTMHDGRVCITIADVTGHGARAAVLMAMTRSLTRAAAAMTAPHHGPGWIHSS